MNRLLVELLYQQCLHDFLIDKLEELGVGADVLRVNLWDAAIDEIGIEDETDQDILSQSFYQLFLEMAESNMKIDIKSGSRKNVEADELAMKKKITTWLDSVNQILTDPIDVDV